MIGENNFIAIKLLQSEDQRIQEQLVKDLEVSEYFTENEYNIIVEKFKNNYKEIESQMIETRNSIINESVYKCEAKYDQTLNEKTGNRLMDAFQLETLFQNSKDSILSEFKSHFNGEEEDIFSRQYFVVS